MNDKQIAEEVVNRIRANKNRGEFSSATVQNLVCYEVFCILRIIREVKGAKYNDMIEYGLGPEDMQGNTWADVHPDRG